MNELLEVIGNLQDCPWAKWRPATLHFCEATKCEWIATPAEFWSNIPYLIVAMILLIRGFREKKGLSSVPLRFGFYALIVGIFSFLFHASHTYVFETLDLASMLFVGIELLIQNISRLGWTRSKSPIALASLIFIGALLLLLGTQGAQRLWIFSSMVIVALWLEGLIYVRSKRLMQGIDYSALLLTLVLFAISYGFWLLDYTGLVCRPDDHYWSGHSLWHVINAACFLTLSRFYSSCRVPVR